MMEMNSKKTSVRSRNRRLMKRTALRSKTSRVNAMAKTPSMSA
jgi:hypothetical protein